MGDLILVWAAAVTGSYIFYTLGQKWSSVSAAMETLYYLVSAGFILAAVVVTGFYLIT